ncbi:hypothetical protein HELRODRAFT_179960 [Helobdella robusta]|uniref:Fucolectin tachylectin-4 pentraxin-1 domain-containing protein n=1 Tax=Helobdella robusta TaxID=6412 RepID=T1FFA5_HELRO|nr:hypothetical protein HELRODRAFT_179960 [Helobdella robusta]ESN94862.1 hypothetical protein HELRODRAFT_179960 [Helobdella robusta]
MMWPHILAALVIFYVILAKLMNHVSANLALNKQTYSSTIYSVTSVSSLAVDGLDYNPDLPADQTCFMSSSRIADRPPCWFAVDLADRYKIKSIVMDISYLSSLLSSLNAVDNMYGVNAGVTDINPSLVEPQLGQYSLCNTYNNAVSKYTSTVSLGCYSNIPAGRFVIVQQSNTSIGYLTICEILLNGTIAARWF